MLDIDFYLKLMVDREATDLFFSAGAPPNLKTEGGIDAVGSTPFSKQKLHELADALMSKDQQKRFAEDWEMNLAIERETIGRFRVNLFMQRGQISIVIRYVRNTIPSIAALNLPAHFQKMVMNKRGLILVVGAVDSGKSTTLASLIDYRNHHSRSHIITIEDPIEYIHRHQQSVIDQREIGFDTKSYAAAMRNLLREAPDVILIGEVRDTETMQSVLSLAQTGHLVMSTLHASNARAAIQRAINFFPDDARERILKDISGSLVAVVGQRLIPTQSGIRIPAVEVLTPTPHLRKLISNGDLGALPQAMEEDRSAHVQTFDQSLYALYRKRLISKEDAIRYADNDSDLNLRINLMGEAGEDIAAAGRA